MATDTDPIVGNWYRHLDKGQEFTVVAVDDDRGLVEIQHFDGDVEELDRDTWYGMPLEIVAEPEDWTGPIDDVEHDDLGYTETDMEGPDWSEPLDEVRKGLR